jgi:hypothetical protein
VIDRVAASLIAAARSFDSPGVEKTTPVCCQPKHPRKLID